MLIPAVFFFLFGGLTAWWVIRILQFYGFSQRVGHLIQHHHTHTGIIPRIGGFGIVGGFSVVYILCFFYLDPTDNRSLIHFGIFAGAVAAFLMGAIDDFWPLRAKLKLLVQIGIALGAYYCGLSIQQFTIPFIDYQIVFGGFSAVISVIWIVSIMNLINLIDGLDALAGGIGFMLAVLLAYLAFESGNAISLILSIGLAGAIAGFLFHNFPPAKVHMGDSGAYAIGYVIAALSLINSEKGTIVAALIAPVLALALPIADVTFAILRRALKGLPLFRPDKEHIHHRLIKAGFSSQRTVLILYAVSLFALVGGLLTFTYQGRFLPIFLGFAFVVVLFTLRGQGITPGLVKNRMLESISMRQDSRNGLYLRDWLVVEAERADSGQNLWSDYRFILKKMGFCRAKLVIGETERHFFLPGTPHNQEEQLWKYEQSIGEYGRLTLYADKENLTDRQFDLVADIAFEAWTKAAARWYELHGESLEFESKAGPPATSAQAKARNLYRPTY